MMSENGPDGDCGGGGDADYLHKNRLVYYVSALIL